MSEAGSSPSHGQPEYSAILFIGDPHVCAYAPGYRLDDYARTVIEKLDFSLKTAAKRRCLPIILGDLFHVPRDNPNWLLVALIEMFQPHEPWVLVGNHDKHEARLTGDVSLAVLKAAGCIRLLDRQGPVDTVMVSGRRVLIGASPDWTGLPGEVAREDHDFVVWVTHMDLRFPGYEAGKTDLKEIGGVDLIVNGHIHLPKVPQRHGRTLWANPGSIARISRSIHTLKVQPSITIWIPGEERLETVPVPHRPFEEVFPPLGDGESDQESGRIIDESMFIKGLENLALRKTSEGVGLKSFLQANLNQSEPVDQLIWELYEEIIKDGRQGYENQVT